MKLFTSFTLVALMSLQSVLSARALSGNNQFDSSKEQISGKLSNKQAVIDIDKFGLKGDGVTDDSKALQDAIDKLQETGGGTLRFGNKSYLINNVIVPSNTKMTGKGTIIKAKDVFYTTTSKAHPKGASTIDVSDASGIKVGDVITIKSAATDIAVVNSKNGNTLGIDIFRIAYGNSETYKGLKYDQSKGATVGLRSQIFWITSGLTLDADAADREVFKGGVSNVVFENISFLGSRNSNTFSAYNIFDLTSSGALYFYRTSNTAVRNCKFDSFYSTSIVYYGWNNGLVFSNNTVENVGYVLPSSVPVQERDGTSGLTLHWDQRFTRSDSELSAHISKNFRIEKNKFIKCWNGGVFASATQSGIIRNNMVNTFVSKGISVYGGDLGISTQGVQVLNNIIINGPKTEDFENLGTAIWISGSDGIVARNNNISNCEAGIILQGARNTKTSKNQVKNTKHIQLTK